MRCGRSASCFSTLSFEPGRLGDVEAAVVRRSRRRWADRPAAARRRARPRNRRGTVRRRPTPAAAPMASRRGRRRRGKRLRARRPCDAPCRSSRLQRMREPGRNWRYDTSNPDCENERCLPSPDVIFSAASNLQRPPACSDWPASAAAQIPGDRPRQAPEVAVLNPRTRVPVGLIIDDSTCLVNLNRFAMPQFDEAFGGKNKVYARDWRSWPVEIPDSFVRTFGDLVRRARRQGQVLDRAVPGLRRAPRSRAARLEPARARRQPRAGAHADGPQLGHPPGDGDAHARDRSDDRSSVRRPVAQVHGELGVDDRAVGRRDRRPISPMRCAS